VKFVRFRDADGAEHCGVLAQDEIRALEGYRDLLPLIELGSAELMAAGRRAAEHGTAFDPSEVHLLSPIETPGTFRDFYAFEQHVRAGRAWRGLDMDPTWYEIPVFYFSNPYAFCGEGDVPMTPGAQQFDFELEVAAVVGKRGRNLTVSEAEDHIIGYCILNDWSGRDIQHREMTLSMGPVKGKDTSTGLGPFLVTKDELAPYAAGRGFDRRMTLTVNGRQYSSANWADVHWSFPQMISYASRGAQVRPGDVIGSGTCGTGCILELSRSGSPDEYPWLQPGDEVVASIEGLGSLRNTVVAAETIHPLQDNAEPADA